MRVLVTGGSGFIGSHVVDLLETRGDVICNYDIKPPTFSAHRPYWHRGDILDQAALAGCMSGFRPHAVLHLAAKAEITATEWEDFASIHRGTENLLAVLADTESVHRFVNVSTQLVIGPQHEPRSLLDFEPYTMYGEAKAYAEAALLQWQAAKPWLTIRPATIWGPHHPSFADNIWKYIGSRAYLHPGGSAPVLRSYGYVRNTAQQMVALMDADPALTHRQVYYVADAVLDSAIWVDAFSQVLTGRAARRVPKPMLRAMGKAGDVALALGKRVPIDSGRVLRMTESYPVPLERTFSITGHPSVSLNDGVRESVDWLRARPGGGAAL